MEDLKNRIKKLYCRNHPGQERFIPHDSLYNLLTNDVIRDAFLQENMEVEHLDELAHEVASRARKIFSILLFINEVPLMRSFFKADQLQSGDLDSKLPFELDHLNKFLPGQESEDFFDNQWEFAVPVFSGKVITRALHPKTRLPFLNQAKKGNGAFGMVFGVEVQPEHWKWEQVPSTMVTYTCCGNGRS